jgi:deazaflavin-dependent oxidoreductase (nitroreductase family)
MEANPLCFTLGAVNAEDTTRLQRLSGKHTLKLTHYGRKSGKPYEVTIWFVFEDGRMYLATANVNRQWVKNVVKNPRVRLAVGGESFEGQVRFIADRTERNQVLDKFRRKYWMYTPAFAVGWLGQKLGLIRNTMGAFEVT